MGCTGSREAVEGIEITLSPEEKYFALETLLRYDKMNIGHLFDTSAEFTTLDNKLTKPNLKSMLETLGLENVGLETADSPLRKLYESFAVQGQYNCQSIKLLGILLSQGSVEDKGRLLFNEFDTDGSKMLEAKEVLNMVSKLCELALVKLPNFSLDTATKKGQASTAKIMRTYAQKLRDYKASAIGFLSAGIVSEGAVSLDDFIKKLAKGNMRSIYNAPYLRSLAIDIKASQSVEVGKPKAVKGAAVKTKSVDLTKPKSAKRLTRTKSTI